MKEEQTWQFLSQLLADSQPQSMDLYLVFPVGAILVAASAPMNSITPPEEREQNLQKAVLAAELIEALPFLGRLDLVRELVRVK